MSIDAGVPVWRYEVPGAYAAAVLALDEAGRRTTPDRSGEPAR